MITSGGVSMGDLDLVKPLLSELAEVHFRRVFMKPGSRSTLRPPATPCYSACRAIRYPPSSVSRCSSDPRCEACSERRRSIALVTECGSIMAFSRPIASSFSGHCSRRLRRTSEGIDHRAAGVVPIGSLVGANALIVVPPGADPIPAGSRVEAILVGPLITGPDRSLARPPHRMDDP